jgi:hypothetical protein
MNIFIKNKNMYRNHLNLDDAGSRFQEALGIIPNEPLPIITENQKYITPTQYESKLEHEPFRLHERFTLTDSLTNFEMIILILLVIIIFILYKLSIGMKKLSIKMQSISRIDSQ